MIVVDPAQEIPDLGHVLRRHVRRRRLQFLDDRRHRVTNGPPVLDGGADIVDHRLHGGGNPGQPFAGLPGDLEMHEGFGGDAGPRFVGLHQFPQPSALVTAHLEDGVDDQVNDQPLAIELGGDGIDQKRHVVGDDLDHRVFRPPAVFFDGRVVDAHGSLAGGAGGREIPVRQGGVEQAVRALLQEVVGRHVPVVLGEETVDRRPPVAFKLPARLADHRSDQVRLLLLFVCAWHGPLFHRCRMSRGSAGRLN